MVLHSNLEFGWGLAPSSPPPPPPCWASRCSWRSPWSQWQISDSSSIFPSNICMSFNLRHCFWISDNKQRNYTQCQPPLVNSWWWIFRLFWWSCSMEVKAPSWSRQWCDLTCCLNQHSSLDLNIQYIPSCRFIFLLIDNMTIVGLAEYKTAPIEPKHPNWNKMPSLAHYRGTIRYPMKIKLAL